MTMVPSNICRMFNIDGVTLIVSHPEEDHFITYSKYATIHSPSLSDAIDDAYLAIQQKGNKYYGA